MLTVSMLEKILAAKFGSEEAALRAFDFPLEKWLNVAPQTSVTTAIPPRALEAILTVTRVPEAVLTQEAGDVLIALKNDEYLQTSTSFPEHWTRSRWVEPHRVEITRNASVKQAWVHRHDLKPRHAGSVIDEVVVRNKFAGTVLKGALLERVQQARFVLERTKSSPTQTWVASFPTPSLRTLAQEMGLL